MNCVGLWHITEMEMWDADYVNMERQAYIHIGGNLLGDFQFGLVVGSIDGDISDVGDVERFEFTWEGSAEMDPVSGRGWCEVDGDRMSGWLKIHRGDDSTFTAVRQ